MADDDVCFDEELLFRPLFTDFAVENAKKKAVEGKSNSSKGKSSKSLKEENTRLKNALRSLISMLKTARGRTTQDSDSEKERCSPLFQAIYFDNRTSIRNREKVEEFVQSLQQPAYDVTKRESYGRENFPPSILELNNELERLAEDGSCSSFPVISSLQYYDLYCLDCCGLPLIEFNPNISDGWTIPTYEQVYFQVLHDNQETEKLRLKQGKACFNCGADHVLQDCPLPRDFAKIDANRKQFMNKFASPVSFKSRYHCDTKMAERIAKFKPGIISENLREALEIGEQELPMYIYRMRYLGYPPGYLPKEAKPSLLLYDGDGNVNDYVEEEDIKDGDDSRSSFIEYPGFNVPLPQGVKDRSAALGMPPMQLHQRVENLAARYYFMKEQLKMNAGNQNIKKRKREELEREEHDMDVEEEEGKHALLELGSAESCETVKRTKYDYSDKDGAHDDSTGYSPSHPGVQYGSEEIELLKRYRKHSASDSQHTEVSSSTNSAQPKKIKRKRKSRTSVEEGEVVSDEELAEESEEEEEVEDAEDDYPETTLGWWLTDPLEPVSTMQPKLSPPPIPRVKLPLEALSRFYTKSTVLQKMSFEDRVMWLDPIYGNLQPVSGRYDKLRKLLGNKSAKK